MFNIPLWSGKVKWQLRDEDGKIEQEGAAHNMLHNAGQQEILNGYFASPGTNWEVLGTDCSWDVGTLTLTDTLGGAVFAATNVLGDSENSLGDKTDGDWLYLAGGYDNQITSGMYQIATRTDDNNVVLETSCDVADVAGGIVAIRMKKLAMGLDGRSAASVGDTAAGVSGYEEDGTGYIAYDLPQGDDDWTIAWDSDEGAYTATSSTCTFTASGTNWQGNRYFFITSYTGTPDERSNEVLLASMSLGNTVTLKNGKSMTAQYVAKLTGTNT